MRQASVQAQGAEPVAVLGVGCRFAGGIDSPDAFWDLLIGGRDGIGEAPSQRWESYAGRGPDFAAALRRAARPGGYLGHVDGFDAQFFGLTPREAELMDPQQRILLETTWEALEHAGVPPGDLAGGDTAVFVGVGSDDYGRRLLEDLPRIEAWTGIGAAMCAVANRISYALDLRGPSLAVDTACSSSLVAVHLALQSLRAGECPVAIAAGVNLIISPGLTLTLEAAGAMAADGRCKSFAASADGYGRGEGCGVLVLKRLADARADGDRVLAIIRGSAVNQDGKTNGIMAPSQEAQRHVLERACRQAGVAPQTVGYVEAHGTGTRLGDPLEASALAAVYGASRTAAEPCLIGSVKSNIGHLEAAAGVARIIKAVLVLERAEIPPTLHCDPPNPAIAWADAGLHVVTERTPWPRRAAVRRAAVSGFGYGGTIAHVVLEEAPGPTAAPLLSRYEAASAGERGVGVDRVDRVPPESPVGTSPRLYPLSAASDNALRQYAKRLADWLDVPAGHAPLACVGHTLALRRSHLEHRAAVVAAGRDELLAGLRIIADGGAGPGVTSGAVAADQGRGLVWVFSGHGSHWAGMGRELLAVEPAFAEVIDSLEPVFAAEIGFSARQALIDGDFGDVARAQTMIFAMQLGLAEVWRSAGVTPDAVIGHSVGEIAAAVTAGALTRQDGALLICRRSRLLRRVAGKGAMAMAALPFAEVAGKLAGNGDLTAAIWSSPVSTVIAGDIEAIDDLVQRWRADGIAVRRVNSDVAFHSAHMVSAARRARRGSERLVTGARPDSHVPDRGGRSPVHAGARRRLLGSQPAQPGPAGCRRRSGRPGRIPCVRRGLRPSRGDPFGGRDARRARNRRRLYRHLAASASARAGDAAGGYRGGALPRAAARLGETAPGRRSRHVAAGRLAAGAALARCRTRRRGSGTAARRGLPCPARIRSTARRAHPAAVADPPGLRLPALPRQPCDQRRRDRPRRGARQHVLRRGPPGRPGPHAHLGVAADPAHHGRAQGSPGPARRARPAGGFEGVGRRRPGRGRRRDLGDARDRDRLRGARGQAPAYGRRAGRARRASRPGPGARAPRRGRHPGHGIRLDHRRTAPWRRAASCPRAHRAAGPGHAHLGTRPRRGHVHRPGRLRRPGSAADGRACR